MVRIGGVAEQSRGGLLGVVQLALERRDELAAHTFDRLGIEPRLGDGEREQLERACGIARQRLHPALYRVAIRREADVDRHVV